MKRNPLVPKYACVPLWTVLAVNMLVYSGTQLLTAGWQHHDLSLPLDARIPFCPAFISIYLLAYVHWVVGYVMAARYSRDLCYRMVSADIVAKLICMVWFLAFPTTAQRPEITGGGFWNWVVSFIYRVDAPANLFPSVHCLESWMCCRAALRMKKASPWYRAGMTVFALLVFASTLLVKQHVIVDVAGGILIAEIGLLAARIFKLERILERLDAALPRRKQ